MNPHQEDVREFHEMVGATIEEWPTMPSIADRKLRLRLLLEELDELATAFGFSLTARLEEARPVEEDLATVEDLVAVADALGDLQYVLDGTAVTCGLDLEPISREIHRSNMLKGESCEYCDGIGVIEDVDVCDDCRGTGRRVTKRADGKVLKGSDWRPPRLAEILAALEARP